MRITLRRERGSILLRVFSTANFNEVAYAVLGISGLQCEVEFPSDWHDYPRGWVRVGLGVVKFAFSFPWSRVVPDNYQCSGPTYGFTFFGDGLHLHWGKSNGKKSDPFTIVAMPWQWRHIKTAHKELSGKETHQYHYTLNSGEVQHRTATISSEVRAWWRPWPPFYRRERSIWVDFDGEVGERTGSWKGGVLGCGYAMLRGESPELTLRRMERERRFR